MAGRAPQPLGRPVSLRHRRRTRPPTAARTKQVPQPHAGRPARPPRTRSRGRGIGSAPKTPGSDVLARRQPSLTIDLIPQFRGERGREERRGRRRCWEGPFELPRSGPPPPLAMGAVAATERRRGEGARRRWLCRPPSRLGGRRGGGMFSRSFFCYQFILCFRWLLNSGRFYVGTSVA